MKIVDYKIGGFEIKLKVSDTVFNPTYTTQILADSIEIKEGDIVLDLGCGVGPLAIVAAKKGAKKVYAIDIQEEACEYARYNVKINDVAGKVDVLCGNLFEPVKGKKFDVIIDDVSGIAEAIARISRWYRCEKIPVANENGTEPVITMLEQSPQYLKEKGILYLPVSTLSDAKKIIEKAKNVFKGNLELVTEKMFPLISELKEGIKDFQHLIDKGIIELYKRGSRYLWSLKIFKCVYL